MSEAFVLYSDGGGQKGSSAAAGCIVEEVETGKRVYLSAFLGPGTNNEAEITGGLLGFSFLSLFHNSIGEKMPIRWVCDSEYVLKSATGYIFGWQRNGWKTASKNPVKNQGLWKAFLSLSRGFAITPEHVRGHTGHVENEACDSISTWLQRNSDSVMRGPDAIDVVSQGEGNWVVLDARPFLETLRSVGVNDPSAENIAGLRRILSINGVSSFGSAPEKKVSSSNSREIEVHPLVLQLKNIAVELRRCGKNDELAAALGSDLDNLLNDYDI